MKRGWLLATLLALGLTGCSQTPVATAPIEDTNTSWPEPLDSQSLAVDAVPIMPALDVGIVVFSGEAAPDDDIEQAVRDIENRLTAHRLRQILEYSGTWGAVRILPAPSSLVPLPSL